MSVAPTLLLGAIAGFTLYLGLPFARLKHPRRSLQAFLNALATGILVFLFWDVMTKASAPITTALAAARSGQTTSFVLLATLFASGFGAGLLSLVYFERRFLRRAGPAGHTAAQEQRLAGPSPRQLALLIALGIGLHNFSEGLAIGQSSRAGAIGLATILIVGFGLHNMTEGFGIAAPLTAGGERPTRAFLPPAGPLVGGAPLLGAAPRVLLQTRAPLCAFLVLAAGA